MIYHITDRTAWLEAKGSGAYTADSLATQGFIHCSTFEQVVRVANTWYAGQRGLVLLEIDESRLKSEVRWEPGTDKPDELFPHIYGPLNVDAVAEVHNFEPNQDGQFSLPRLCRNDFSLCIRPAKLADLELAVSLIRISMGEELDWLFGQEKGHPTERVVAALFTRKGNRLSHDICWVAEEQGRVVGALMAFRGRMLRRFDVQTALQLVGIFGFAATMRLAQRQSIYKNLVESEADEFYLSNLAVFPDCQGRGIGTSMLNYVDQLAQANRLRKCSLLVTFGNPARRLYERAGYQMVQTFEYNHPMVADGSGGFYRMVKDLNASS